MHLAQINIAEWKVDPQSAEAAPFMDMLDSVNGLADRMDGFIWRLIGDGGAEEALFTDGGKKPVIINMSVWENAETLEHFVWNTVHKQVYQRKEEWFKHTKMAGFVMWWVEEGHQPTLAEAKARLDHLNEHGDSDFAFGWAHLPNVKLWQEQRCG